MASWLLEKFTGGGAKQQEEDNSVKLVLQRTQTTTLYEEKLESIEKLLELSADRKQDFGKTGLATIIELLQKEKENVDIARPLLEVMSNLISFPTSPSSSSASATAGSATSTATATLSKKDQEQISAAKSYMDIILAALEDRKSSPIICNFLSTILSLLKIYENDYYIKYHCVKLITQLLKHDSARMQQFILMEGTAISKFIALLRDSHEAIRNEGLLLLNTMSSSGNNKEVQKIIAFEGTFEQLFEIIREEGGNSGGIVVHDCLQVIYNLIKDNQSNQKYFREIGCIPYLNELLQIEFIQKQQIIIQKKKENSEGILSTILGQHSKITQGMKSIILLTLAIALELVKPTSDNPSASKDVIGKTKVLDAIIAIAFCEDEHDVVPDQMRFQALYILGWITFKHRHSQEILESYNFVKLQDDQIETALIRLCKMVLYEEVELKRQLAFDCLKKFLHENKEGQLFIASTVKPPAKIKTTAEEGMLCGITLAESLFGVEKPKHHNLESYHASTILAIIIRQNNKCKDVLLEMPYELRSGKPPVSFFSCVVRTTIQSIKQKAAIPERNIIGLLKLLCEWIFNSPAAVHFMENMSNFLAFIDIVSANSSQPNPHIEGLSSLLVGLIFSEYDDSLITNPGGYTQESIYESIKRLGINKLKDKWSALQYTPEFQNAQKDKQQYFETIPESVAPVNYYDNEFINMCHASFERILKQFKEFQPGATPKVIQPIQLAQKTPPSPAGTTASPSNNNNNAVDEEVIKQYKKQVGKLEKDINGLKQQLLEAQATIQSLQQNQQVIESLQIENQQLKSEKQSVPSLIEAAKSEVQAQVEQLELKLAQKENELRGKQKEYMIRQSMSEDNMKNLNFQLEQKEKDLVNLAKAYEQMETFLRDRDQENDRIQQSVTKQETKMNALEKENERLKLLVQEQEKKLREEQSKGENPALVAENQRLVESLSHMEGLLKRAETELADSTDARNRLTAEVKQLMMQNSTNENTMRDLSEKNVRQQEAQLQLRQQLEEAQRAVSTFQALSLRKDEQINALKMQVAQAAQGGAATKLLEQQLAETTGELRLKDAKIEELAAALRQKEERVEELEQDNMDMMDIIEKLEEKLKATGNSSQ